MIDAIAGKEFDATHTSTVGVGVEELELLGDHTLHHGLHGLQLYQATLQRPSPQEPARQVQLQVTIALFADYPPSPPAVVLDWIVPPKRFAQGPRGPPPALRAPRSPIGRSGPVVVSRAV